MTLKKLRSYPLYSVFRFAPLVVSSSAIAAICGMITLAFNARSLGPAQFGTLSLIQAFTALISALATPESWQVIVRMGAKHPSELGITLSCGIALDVIAAIFAGFISILTIVMFSKFLELTPDNMLLALIYSASLFAGVGGTPKGYFRLIGRYDVLVGNQLAQGFAALLLSGVLWAISAPLLYYVVSFSLVASIYNISLLLRLILQAKTPSVALVLPFRDGAHRRHFGKFLRMASGTSLLATLNNTRRQTSILIAGLVLGDSAAGLFAVASKISTIVTRVAGPLNQAIFPEVIKLSSAASAPDSSRSLRRLTILAGIVVALVALPVIYLRAFVVGAVVGSEFVNASNAFALLFLAECFLLAGIHFNPLIQGSAGARPMIMISLIWAGVYLILAFSLSPLFGLLGLASSSLIAAAGTYCTLFWYVRSLGHRRRVGPQSRK